LEPQQIDEQTLDEVLVLYWQFIDGSRPYPDGQIHDLPHWPQLITVVAGT
jgi:hypothetical protein